MKCAASKSILRFSIVSATMAISLATTTNAWSANLNFVSTRAALEANDFVDWSNTITPITNAPPATTFSLNSAGGLTVTGSQAGAFGEVRRQNPTPSIVGTNSPSPSNAYQNSTFWNGNFAANDAVYWNQGSGALTLSFSTPVAAVGTQLASPFYRSSDRANLDFLGTITANYGSGLSQTFRANGRTNALADNSAAFFGVRSDSADITSIVFNDFDIPTTTIDPSTGLPLGSGYFNYAINRVSFSTSASAQAVPEPFSILGTLFGSAAALKMRKRFKANNKL